MKALLNRISQIIDKILTWKQQTNHVATKLNKINAMLQQWRETCIGSNVVDQSTMQYLSPIYAMLYLFGRKTLIQFKSFINYRKNPVNNILSDQKFPHRPSI